MLNFEKKLYAFIDKYLHVIVAFAVSAVVLFMNRQVLYCVRPYTGADMWEASEVFVHSPLYILFLRTIWIGMFNGSYEWYYMCFWIFTYSTAVLGAIIFYQYKHKLVSAFVFYCIALITPVALLYGPVMAHTDGICMTLILAGVLVGRYIPAKLRWIPLIAVSSIAVALQTNYIFAALILVIYGLLKKKKEFVYVPCIALVLSLHLNIAAGSFMGFSVSESIPMVFRFFYISQGTGTVFSSVFSWICYMIFWNGYWIAMPCLFGAFTFPKKAPIYTLVHILIFFFSVTVFLNGYF